MNNLNNLKEKLGNLKDKSIAFFKRGKERLSDLKWSDIKESKAGKVALGSLSVVLMATIINTSTKAYVVSLNGEEIGTIKNEEEIDLVLEELKEELKSTYEMDIVLEDELELSETNTMGDSLVEAKEIKEEIKKKVSFQVEGYVLKIDGEEIGALKTKEEIEEVIEELKSPYEEEAKEILELDEKEKSEDKEEGEEPIVEEEDLELVKEGEKEKPLVEKEEKSLEPKYTIETLEEIEIEKAQLPIYEIGEKEDLKETLKTGGEEINTHIVEVGESLWTIAKIYDMTMEELIEANPDRDPDDLQIGDEVKLVKEKPLLTIATILEREKSEEVDYEVEIEKDANKYTNEREVKREGKKGKAKLLVKEVRHNGKLMEEEVIDKEIIEEPVEELVVQGTKEIPKTMATGNFRMPTRGRISSRYGMRNGRMHKGLDIAARVGTPITAADGGRVVSAGWSGAYGKLVVIDHENGYRTKYAHCNSIHVKPGQRVYKGQHIADVGNTGRSTGPHLHIEVLKNGRNVNPSSYLGK